jgi:hypothetical protein
VGVRIDKPYAVTDNDGTRSTSKVGEALTTGDAAALNAVSCSSSTFCAAVGQVSKSSSQHAMTTTFDGGLTQAGGW